MSTVIKLLLGIVGAVVLYLVASFVLLESEVGFIAQQECRDDHPSELCQTIDEELVKDAGQQ